MTDDEDPQPEERHGPTPADVAPQSAFDQELLANNLIKARQQYAILKVSCLAARAGIPTEAPYEALVERLAGATRALRFFEELASTSAGAEISEPDAKHLTIVGRLPPIGGHPSGQGPGGAG